MTDIELMFEQFVKMIVFNLDQIHDHSKNLDEAKERIAYLIKTIQRRES